MRLTKSSLTSKKHTSKKINLPRWKFLIENADLRHVLQRGKLISLDHEVFTIKQSGDFTSTKIPPYVYNNNSDPIAFPNIVFVVFSYNC